MERVIALLLHDVYRRRPSESGFAGPAADRYKLTLEEFRAQLLGVARALNGAARPDAPAPWIHAGDARLAITVDDGGSSYHAYVAEWLEAFGWRGHCLVTTGQLGRRGFLRAHELRDLAARGHTIGTHSVSHPSPFSALPWERMVREWGDSRAALEDVLGTRVTCGSVPGGAYSRRVAEAAGAAGLTQLFTSEPTTRVTRVGDCVVVGRFTVRAGSRPAFAGEIVRQHSNVLLREWAAWNAKKLLKHVLGGAYPRLAGQWQRTTQRS